MDDVRKLYAFDELVHLYLNGGCLELGADVALEEVAKTLCEKISNSYQAKKYRETPSLGELDFVDVVGFLKCENDKMLKNAVKKSHSTLMRYLIRSIKNKLYRIVENENRPPSLIFKGNYSRALWILKNKKQIVRQGTLRLCKYGISPLKSVKLDISEALPVIPDEVPKPTTQSKRIMEVLRPCDGWVHREELKQALINYFRIDEIGSFMKSHDGEEAKIDPNKLKLPSLGESTDDIALTTFKFEETLKNWSDQMRAKRPSGRISYFDFFVKYLLWSMDANSPIGKGKELADELKITESEVSRRRKLLYGFIEKYKKSEDLDREELLNALIFFREKYRKFKPNSSKIGDFKGL